MANGFGSFYIGSSGLTSAQNALNVTANNLSNIDTQGYVREQVRFADRNYDVLKDPTAKTNMHQSGLGVTIGDVYHARDIFLDKAFRTENGRYSFYSTCGEVTDYVIDLFQELEGEQFKGCISDLWQAFQELSKDPADSVNQNLVIQKSELLVSRTQALYSDLQSYQANLNRQISSQVDKVNEMGNRIYELNLQIQKVEAGKQETAMTLRDERDALIDELSGYVNISTLETATGFMRISLEGVEFIDENRCYNIGLKSERGTGFYTPYWPQLSDIPTEKYVPVFRVDGEISSEYNNDIGSIKALLISRGSGYGRASDMADLESYSKVQDCTVMETEAEVDQIFHTIITTMNDLFCPNKKLEAAITVTNPDGTSTIYGAGTKVLDTDTCPVGVDGKLPPQELYVRNGRERYTEVTADDGKTYYIYNEEFNDDPRSQYSIGNISVNEALQKQVTLLPAYTQNNEKKEVDYALGRKLAAAWEETNMRIDPYDTAPCNFERYYEKIIGKLSNNGNTYQSAADTLAGSSASLENKRQQVMGVSSDEELTAMVKYQSAYNAASRFINVINEMTELIVTGLI